MSQSKLYVGNLSYVATEQEVNDLFSQHGAVKAVQIIMDRYTGRSRGFAFVEMEDQAGATKAKDALSGFSYQDRSLIIDWARDPAPREERGSRGGDRGDRGGDRGDRGGDRGGERDFSRSRKPRNNY
jgi:RNA recognition motif-containing protein